MRSTPSSMASARPCATKTADTRSCCARPCRPEPRKAACCRCWPRNRVGMPTTASPSPSIPNSCVKDARFAISAIRRSPSPVTIAGAPSTAGYEAVEALYSGVEAPFIRTTTGVAESVKCLSNAFHAVKIAFANEAGVLLKSLGVDAQEAMKVFCADRQLIISPAYLRPGFAFGGSCLPKDVSALVAMAKANDIALPFLSSVMPANDAHIDRALQTILDEGRCKVALLGLAFKPGTDDLRHSPFVYLAERLIGKGYDLAIFDRNVNASKLLGKNREFIEREIPHFDRLLVGDLHRALDGAGMIVIGHASREDIALLEAEHDGRPILDLQGVPALAQLSGVRYRSLC